MRGGPAQWLRTMAGTREPDEETGRPPVFAPADHEPPADLEPADESPVPPVPPVQPIQPVEPVGVATVDVAEPALAVPEPPDSRLGDLRDVSTAAPHVGRLRPAVTPILRPATALRSPSVVLDGLRCGDYGIAGASHAGSSHLHDGTPRQDSYDFVVGSTGRLVVAVADGLGSRPYSQLGARLFGEQVVQLALEQPDQVAEAYLTEAAERAGVFAQTHYGVTARDVGFVAQVAVFEADVCTIARVGDVSAFARSPEAEFVELFPDDGGSMNSLSVSLPGPAKPETVTVRSDRVVLVTDGMAGDIRLSPGVREWLTERWSAPVSASLMNDSLRFRRQGSQDDRTAVVVWHWPEQSA